MTVSPSSSMASSDADSHPFIRPGSYRQKVYWSLVFLGWWRTLLVVLAKPVDRVLALTRPSLWYQDFTERLFDTRHGVATHTRIQLDEMDDFPVSHIEEANEHGPTRAMDFGHLMGMLDLDHARYDFFDVGSGLGRALLLAQWFPFRSITGVELAESLHQAAVRNLLDFRGPKRAGEVRCLNADALEAPLPTGDFVCFMFNPFPGTVLEEFLQRLEGSLAESPREVILAYGNSGPDHVAALDASPSLERVWVDDLHGQYVVYRTPFRQLGA